MANGGDGELRPRARESEGETGENEREQGGSGRAADVVHAARGVGKQEVAARPCAREHAAASGRGEEDDGELQCWAGSAASWAGQLAGPHSGGAQVSFPLFFCFCFYLIYLQLC